MANVIAASNIHKSPDVNEISFSIDKSPLVMRVITPEITSSMPIHLFIVINSLKRNLEMIIIKIGKVMAIKDILIAVVV